DPQARMAAAGADDDRRAGGLVRGRQEGRDGGVVDVGVGVFAPLLHLLQLRLALLALEARRAVGPQGDVRVLAAALRQGGQEEDEQNERHGKDSYTHDWLLGLTGVAYSALRRGPRGSRRGTDPNPCSSH